MEFGKSFGQTLGGTIIAGMVAMAIIAGTVAWVCVKSFSATKRSEEIHPGVEFSVEYVSDNPFEENIVFGGECIDRKGNYIKYVTPDGDTCSTNIKDVYEYPKMFKVSVK